MLKAEPLTGAARYRSIWQRHDNRHLRQLAQGMRPYPERPSGLNSLWINVLVMIFGEIVNPAFKQCDDPIGGVKRYYCPTRSRTAVSSRFSDPFGRLLTLHHGQLNSLSIFKSNFGERLKNPVFVESFDGVRHV